MDDGRTWALLRISAGSIKIVIVGFVDQPVNEVMQTCPGLVDYFDDYAYCRITRVEDGKFETSVRYGNGEREWESKMVEIETPAKEPSGAGEKNDEASERKAKN